MLAGLPLGGPFSHARTAFFTPRDSQASHRSRRQPPPLARGRWNLTSEEAKVDLNLREVAQLGLRDAQGLPPIRSVRVPTDNPSLKSALSSRSGSIGSGRWRSTSSICCWEYPSLSNPRSASAWETKCLFSMRWMLRVPFRRVGRPTDPVLVGAYLTKVPNSAVIAAPVRSITSISARRPSNTFSRPFRDHRSPKIPRPPGNGAPAFDAT